MALEVIGAGVGRTGTYSLKLALEQLGFGPCHHMEEVIMNPHRHVPIWSAAVEGKPDWEAAYDGYNSAVDWPTAAFWDELSEAYPEAKFILTTRDAERWCDSFSETIFRLLQTRSEAPPEMRPFLDMGHGVTVKTGFDAASGREGLVRNFRAHCEAVKGAIPAERLLVYEVREGWGPLCEFLGKPVPDAPFPNTNGREEFWERIGGPPA
ncbi:MAG TPA: sulfotransferase [Burkholderiales bacterium]|nr:sulfotransferase [Burkholderiales bacterium]